MKENNVYLEPALQTAGKLYLYHDFVASIPNGKINDNFFDYLSKLTLEETNELVDNLASLNHIKDLDCTVLYGNPDSVIGRLFKIYARGTGTGELAVAWMINGAKISGNSKSYDVTFQNSKYEIKDWSSQSPNASILAGVKSKVINFEFWYEVIDTLRRLDKLTGKTEGTIKFDLSEYFEEEFVDLAYSVLDAQRNILSGEVGKKMMQMLRDFYFITSKISSDIDGYTNLILRGPNITPIEISISPIDDVNIQSFQVNPIKKDGKTYILTELRRLKYVRDPEEFDKDLQSAVNQITDDVTYIVFRKNKINFVSPGGFKPDVITISSLKFIERDL